MAFDHKHLIDIAEYSADDIMTILETAERFKAVNERRIKQVPTLKGYTIVNMFNEPSTRTRSSFEIAEKRLSANSLNFGGSSTSTVKGESLVDTVETLCAYKIDMIIVRDKHAGVPRKIADVSGAHVIDAGDGKHQHPTQALLDLYSIWEAKGDLSGLHVGVVGDIGHSRVCGSLIPALKIMGCEVTVVAPQTLLPARPDVLGADHVTSRLDEALPELDVVYMLRIQRERLEGAPYPSLREYNLLYGLTKERDRLMKPDALICHPGPINRGVELDSYMADAPEAVGHYSTRSMRAYSPAWPPCTCCLEGAKMALLLKGARAIDPQVGPERRRARRADRRRRRASSHVGRTAVAASAEGRCERDLGGKPRGRPGPRGHARASAASPGLEYKEDHRGRHALRRPTAASRRCRCNAEHEARHATTRWPS